MRYTLPLLFTLLASPAFAAQYSPDIRADFIKGCNAQAATQSEAIKAKVKSSCDCTLDGIQKSMTQEQFLAMGDKAQEDPRLIAVIQSCLAQAKPAK